MIISCFFFKMTKGFGPFVVGCFGLKFFFQLLDGMSMYHAA